MFPDNRNMCANTAEIGRRRQRCPSRSRDIRQVLVAILSSPLGESDEQIRFVASQIANSIVERSILNGASF